MNTSRSMFGNSTCLH